MRSLAEFIMRGRAQAATVAFLGFFIPLASSSTVSLVSLRRGGWDGFTVLAWAMLPAIVMGIANPESLVITFYHLCVLVAAMGGAMVLRNQGLWPAGALGLVVLSAFGGLIYHMTFAEANEQMAAELNAQLEAQGNESSAGLVTATLLSGAFAIAVALHAVLALVIGRWWQAMLYNPGGFRQEFYELRLSRTQALLCFGVSAICLTRSDWVYWGLVAALPLVLQCAAVVHNRVGRMAMSPVWLVFFYLLMLMPAFLLMAALLGFSDSWIDFRRRFGPPGSGTEADQHKPDE